MAVSTVCLTRAPVGNKLAPAVLNKGGTLHINMLSADGDSQLLCAATVCAVVRPCADCCGFAFVFAARLRTSPDANRSPTGLLFQRHGQHPWEPAERWERSRGAGQQRTPSLRALPEGPPIYTKPTVIFSSFFYHLTPDSCNKLKKNPVYFLFIFALVWNLTGFIQQVMTVFAGNIKI